MLADDNGSQFGVHNCKLAFSQLPCMTFGSGRVGAGENLDFRAGQTLSNEAVAQQSAQLASRFAYNPLTDINWQSGGEVKPSFGRKIAAKLERLHRQASAQIDPAKPREDYFDPRLRCVANSEFARKMLNHATEKKNHSDGVDSLALFACRLFVYQQTWMNSLHEGQVKDGDRVQVYLTMFYWTAYAIQCFMVNKPLADKLHIRLLSDGAKIELLNSVLRSIFIFDGNPLEKEYFYLSRLACILSYGEVKHQPLPDAWYQGFRYRPAWLIEKAIIASGGGHSRHIQFISAFKQTEFYHLNKAAQHHCMWLDEQLELAGFVELSTTQYCHF